MLHIDVSYLIKVVICSGLFTGYYWLGLRNKTHHQFNRFYLLFVVLLALILPMIDISWNRDSVTVSTPIQLLSAVNQSEDQLEEFVQNNQPQKRSIIEWLEAASLLISCFLFFKLIIQLFKIKQLVRKYPFTLHSNFRLYQTDEEGSPFSFLSHIFWNRKIDLDSQGGQQILKHEMAHVQQKHSYDKLIMSAVRIIGWWNPFFWLIKKELDMVHEFCADQKAIDHQDSTSLANMILQSVYPQYQFPISNSFFHSPIKRRLVMLQANPNPATKFNRVLTLPLCLLVFAFFSISLKNSPKSADGSNPKKLKVVIDAGHGGKDAGGQNLSKTITEKELSFQLAQAVQQWNTNANIEIILSRTTDEYLSPKERVQFATDKQADLFISLHLDVARKDRVDLKSGMRVFIAREEFKNVPSSRLLASALISTFNSNYELPIASNPMQRNIGIWVIQANSCPSVLIEAGFMTNQKDVDYLSSAKGQQALAANVLNAIDLYNQQSISNQ